MLRNFKTVVPSKQQSSFSDGAGAGGAGASASGHANNHRETRTHCHEHSPSSSSSRKKLLAFLLLTIYFQQQVIMSNDHGNEERVEIIRQIRQSRNESKLIRDDLFLAYSTSLVDNHFHPFIDSKGVYKNANSSCGGGSKTFHESFRTRGVFDFRTQVKTNLNILYIGSSITAQFFKNFEQSLLPVEREVIRYAWGHYHENAAAARTSDGGVLGLLRVTGLMDRRKNIRNNPKKMAPMGGGGWLDYDVRELKRLVHTWRNVTSIDTAFGEPTSPCEVNSDGHNIINASNNFTNEGNAKNGTTLFYPCEQKSFDVIVHQIPVEWCSHQKQNESATTEAIHELVDISFNEIGANTIILQTIAINNNIYSIDEVTIANERIWRFARDYESYSSGSNSTHPSKRQILVMDLFAYSAHMFLENSIGIGLVPSEKGMELRHRMKRTQSTDYHYDAFLNVTLELNEYFNSTDRKYRKGGPRKKGQMCGNSQCDKESIITNDGIHYCMDETGSRIDAVLACLIQCSLLKDDDDDHIRRNLLRLNCERKCNKQYMSLEPVLISSSY